MTNRMRRTFPTIVAGSLGIGAAFASAAEPSQQDLINQIEQLKEKVANLEQKQVSSVDVDATVERVLRDANNRSQLLQNDGSFLAGYDNTAGRFVLRNADNSFSFSPQIHYQARNITNWREDGKFQGTDDLQNGFEMRRVKLELEGTAFSPDFSYFIQFAASRNGGGVGLEDAWVRYMFAPDWGLRVGQFKDPFSHEELTSDKRIQTIDRSMVNELLHPGGGAATRVQGVTLIYGGYQKDNPLNVEGGITDGAGSLNTNFVDDTQIDNFTNDGRPDFGFAGRAEYKVAGDWKDYRDFSARNNKQDLLVVGVGVDWTGFNGGNDYTGIVDAVWENSAGLSVYAAAVGNFFDSNGFGESFNYGGVLQVGYMINPNVEIYGRADCTVFEDDFNGEDTYPEFTFGANYFFGKDGMWGHRCKLSVDISWLPNGAPTDLTGIGYLANPGDNEIVIKGQFQFYL